MERCSTILVVLWTCIVQLGISDVEMPYYLDPILEEEVKNDDNKQAVQKVRRRIAEGMNKTYGVVMVATSDHQFYSRHTIPIWKAYCEKHGYDFFLQETSLNPGVRDHWTKPRVLMELATKSLWKYAWVVDPNSLPVNLDKGFQYAIKEHMRKVRFKNDKQKERILWCPEDCEKSYEDAVNEGACYGPHISGCIFWFGKKTQMLPMLELWYRKRKTMDDEVRGLKKALMRVRDAGNYDVMYWSDVGAEFGHPDSSFFVTHLYDEQLGYNMRDQVIRTIGQHKALGAVLNQRGEHRPEL